MVSGTVSLPCSGYFSPFPHGTGTLSVSREYLALPDGPGGFTQDSSCPALLRIPLCFVSLRVRASHPLRTYFPEGSTHEISCNGAVLQPRTCRNMSGLGSSPFARHYWGNHCLFSFPAGTKMFQFPALASRVCGMSSLQDDGLSHSEIRGSKVICTYPRLVAAYHVLHRLREPSQGIRHVPFLAFFRRAEPRFPFSGEPRTAYTFSFNFYFFSVTTCQRTFPVPGTGEWRITDSNR